MQSLVELSCMYSVIYYLWQRGISLLVLFIYLGPYLSRTSRLGLNEGGEEFEE